MTTTTKSVVDSVKDAVKTAIETGLKNWLNDVLQQKLFGVKMEHHSEDIVNLAFVSKDHKRKYDFKVHEGSKIIVTHGHVKCKHNRCVCNHCAVAVHMPDHKAKHDFEVLYSVI